MKVVAITIIILIAFFFGTVWINQYITNSADHVTNMIDKLDEAITNEDWEAAQVHIKEVSESWDETKSVWQTFLEHYEIDTIDIVLARLKKYVSIEERALSLGAVAELKLLIEHIVDREAFKLTNIL